MCDLDHLDRPHAETILAFAAVIAQLISDDEAAVICNNQAQALDLVLVNTSLEEQIDDLLSGPPLGWVGLPNVRRWAGLYGASALARDLPPGAFEALHQSIPPEHRTAWAESILQMGRGQS